MQKTNFILMNVNKISSYINEVENRHILHHNTDIRLNENNTEYINRILSNNWSLYKVYNTL